MANYLPRLAEKEIARLVRSNPVVVLVGPRQVGKTSLAKHIAAHLPKEAVYFDLENPDDYYQLANPTLVLDQLRDKTVILDEVQRVPALTLLDILGMRPSRFDKPGRSGYTKTKMSSSVACAFPHAAQFD
ncbi:MAG: AAA family ATPase [Saprospiraceae bacterium]